MQGATQRSPLAVDRCDRTAHLFQCLHGSVRILSVEQNQADPVQLRGNVVFEAGRCRICREELKPNRQKRKQKSTALTQAKRLERQVNLNWRHADSADASQVFADLTAR